MLNPDGETAQNYFTEFEKSVNFMPRIKWSGAYCFCPVCLSDSVVNFNLGITLEP